MVSGGIRCLIVRESCRAFHIIAWTLDIYLRVRLQIRLNTGSTRPASCTFRIAHGAVPIERRGEVKVQEQWWVVLLSTRARELAKRFEYSRYRVPLSSHLCLAASMTTEVFDFPTVSQAEPFRATFTAVTEALASLRGPERLSALPRFEAPRASNCIPYA